MYKDCKDILPPPRLPGVGFLLRQFALLFPTHCRQMQTSVPINATPPPMPELIRVFCMDGACFTFTRALLLSSLDSKLQSAATRGQDVHLDYPGDVFEPIARWLCGCNDPHLTDEKATEKCAMDLSLQIFCKHVEVTRSLKIAIAEAKQNGVIQQPSHENSMRMVVCARCGDAQFASVPTWGLHNGTNVQWRPCDQTCAARVKVTRMRDNVCLFGTWHPETYFQLTKVLWIWPGLTGPCVCMPYSVISPS